MFAFRRRRAARQELIDRFHGAVVEASRAPYLYGPGGLPDTVDGRFEWLTLHVMLVLRRLRALPAPAGEVAQELVDSVFAHLEIALRESGIGDFGVPKRMKKIGQGFYDRASHYEAAWAAGSGMLAAEAAKRVGEESAALGGVEPYLAEAERGLASCDLDRLLAGPPFPSGLPVSSGLPVPFGQSGLPGRAG